MSLTSRFSAVGRAMYETQRGRYAAELEQFVNPSSAAGAVRTLWPDNECRPACPIYQRGNLQVPMIDVGPHMERAIIAVPHHRCPVLVSHADNLEQLWFVPFDGHYAQGCRLRDNYTGRPAVTPLSPSFASGRLAADFSMPCSFTLPGTTGIAIPLHSAFSGDVVTPNELTEYGEFFITPVEVGLLNVVGIPVAGNMSVRVQAYGEILDGSAAAAIKIRIETIDATGTPTITVSGAGYYVSAGALANGVSVPAGAVALTGVSLYNDNAAATQCSLTGLRVSLFTAGVSSVDLVSQLGVFSGEAVSGSASLDTCYAVRTNALSVMVSNITSALNANGYVLSCGVHGTTPAEAGITGPVSLGERRSVMSTPLVDGMYGALLPSKELPYNAPFAPPTAGLNTGYIYCRSQDATPVQTKVEYHLVVELVTEDPMFPPVDVPVWPIETWQSLQRNPDAFLIHTENKMHWQAIRAWLNKWVPKVGKFVSEQLAKSPNPHAQAASQAIDAGLNVAQSLGAFKGKKAARQGAALDKAALKQDAEAYARYMAAPSGRKGK